MVKHKFKEQSALRKSVQPVLIVLSLLLVAFVAYKAYVGIQKAIRYVLLITPNSYD